NLCISLCSSDYIFICISDAWRIVSEDSRNLDGFLRFIVSTIFALSIQLFLAFPADCLHPSYCHCLSQTSNVGYSDFPAYSQVLLRLFLKTLGPLYLRPPFTGASIQGFACADLSS